MFFILTQCLIKVGNSSRTSPSTELGDQMAMLEVLRTCRQVYEQRTAAGAARWHGASNAHRTHYPKSAGSTRVSSSGEYRIGIATAYERYGVYMGVQSKPQ